MIKVAFVIDTIEAPTAGTEKQLLSLLEHLDRAKIAPYLCVLHASEWLKDQFRTCRVIDIGVRSLASPRGALAILRFSRFLRTEGIHIVHTFFTDGNKVGVLAAKIAGAKVISSRRNQGYWHDKNEIRILRLLNPWVNLFLANSTSTRQWLTTAEGIAEHRTAVVYNGVDLDRFPCDRETGARSRRIFGFPEHCALIGVVANLRAVKGLDVFLRAFRLVTNRVEKVHAIIVGEGEERLHLEALVQELDLGKIVRFLGRRDDVPEILETLDLGVLPSNSESSSNALIEYLAAGLPVVSTDVGGAREAIDEGRNGFIVPVGDHEAMADRMLIALEPNRAQAMGQAGRRIAESRFSTQAMVSAMERVYAHLVEAKL